MRRSSFTCSSAARVALLAAVLAGCGGGGTTGGGGQDAAPGGTTDGSSGGTTGGSSGGTTGGSSGGTTTGSPPAGATGQICRIGILGFRGQWGEGNVFSDWLQTKSTDTLVAIEDQVLDPALLASVQVVIAEDVRAGSAGQTGVGKGIGREYSADEVAALSQWVAAGGGLMTLAGFADASELGNVNRLLAPYGLSYGSSGILGGGGGYTVPVTHWADHPLAQGITKVGVDNGYPVLGGGTLVAWEPSPDQWPVGRALESGTGHVFAWGDEWISYNSEWTGKPDYQVAQFWANTLEWLSRTSGCTVPLPPGNEW